jgi:hypothetical protein
MDLTTRRGPLRRWLLTAPIWQVGLVAWFVGVPLVLIPLGTLGYEVSRLFRS